MSKPKTLRAKLQSAIDYYYYMTPYNLMSTGEKIAFHMISMALLLLLVYSSYRSLHKTLSILYYTQVFKFFLGYIDNLLSTFGLPTIVWVKINEASALTDNFNVSSKMMSIF
ncbi:hypothetical protein PACTADRAFT_3049 [Pachysolen tannophilus NRRL Y-2460]|uniref:Uncharacterized protein n=1 Tax=Pachysolen tannophilus NRRL Y-2460 TaxID=669874 RepID=A0A1E4TUE9_PACTA|nr:hypothetical protein PACTADRAFT_3049 [Pachysolen tannophilus NRRL Y-2460]